MKKAFFVACLLVLGSVMTSQAVVIHWSTDGYGSLSWSEVGSAFVVYVAEGAPAYANDVLSNGSVVGGVVTGLAITPGGVGEQSSTDSTGRSSGAYYVVLLNEAGTSYAYSTTSLAWDNTTAITWDEMAPATGVFSPSEFSGWTPVPEPSTALLLFAGAVVAALRRGKRA